MTWILFAAVLTVIAVVCVVAVGLPGGITFAIAIGAATAVAIFGDTRSSCSPRFFRRRN